MNNIFFHNKINKFQSESNKVLVFNYINQFSQISVLSKVIFLACVQPQTYQNS